MVKTKLSARVDADTKEKANEIFQKLGLNLSTAVNVYLHSVVINQGVPFALTLNKVNITGAYSIEFEEKAAYSVVRAPSARQNSHPQHGSASGIYKSEQPYSEKDY